MQTTIFFLCIFFSMYFGCSAQTVSGNQNQEGQKIIDPVEVPSFNIVRRSIFVSLPDSLGGKNATGLSGLQLFINKNSVVDSFKIMKLLTYKEGKEMINYNQSQPLSDKVNKFYPFFAAYIKKNLKIKRSRNYINTDAVTIMSIMVRFGKPNVKSLQ